MSEFNKETLRHLETLCRVKCTEEEEEMFVENIKTILDYIDRLSEVDTENVKPLYSVLEAVHLPVREDVAKEPMDRQTLLNNAPASTAGMVRVPPVI